MEELLLELLLLLAALLLLPVADPLLFPAGEELLLPLPLLLLLLLGVVAARPGLPFAFSRKTSSPPFSPNTNAVNPRPPRLCCGIGRAVPMMVAACAWTVACRAARWPRFGSLGRPSLCRLTPSA